MGVNAVLYYGPTIFENSGLSSGDSLFYQSLIGVVNAATTVIMFFIDKIGRKNWFTSEFRNDTDTDLIGLYFFKGQEMGLSNLFLLVCFLLYIFLQPINQRRYLCVLIGNVPDESTRSGYEYCRTITLVGTFLIGQLTPWMLSTLTPAGTFWLFAVMCIPYILIVWRLMPETAGKSLEDIERFWMKEKK